MTIYRIKPKTNRWGMKYGAGNNGGWHWYDILIGVLLFVGYIILKKYILGNF